MAVFAGLHSLKKYMTTSPPLTRSVKAFPRLCCFALALAFTGLLPAFGATITVTTTNDTGAGSLRNAVATANSNDTINFNLPNPSTIILTSGQLEINKNLTITGPGAAQLAISGNKTSFKVFFIDSGASVIISGLTVENGATVNGTSDAGGGIVNLGTLTLINGTVTGNAAPGSEGGGIISYGALTLIGSTVSGNSASEGGGIRNYNGTLTLINSTVSGNSATGVGGGIVSAGALTIINSTLSGNSAPSGTGAGIYIGSLDGLSEGTLTLESTLLANNGVGGNCFVGGTSTSLGYNLSDDTTCEGWLTLTTDKNNTPAGLDPKGLQNNGGPTQTIALLPTSPAVDAIPVASCTDTNGNPVKTDQHGVTRPQGAGCDIGAYELVQAVPFSDFDAFLAIQTGQHSGFALSAWFTLGSASDGIRPLTEAVTLQIANYTVTIPAGSFHKLWNSSQAPYGYEGTINGTKLVVGIIPLGGKNYQFDAAGSPVVWNGVKNPVTVSLTIGNDTGSKPVNAVISSR